VPPHPILHAASCANSSPNPSIKPFTNGKNRLIAAPRSKLQNVGGLYRIIGELELDDGACGDGDRSSDGEVPYCSLSEGMVTPEAVRSEGVGWWGRASGEAMAVVILVGGPRGGGGRLEVVERRSMGDSSACF
jgi:hypothetical protein